jgi:hypothetical protein
MLTVVPPFTVSPSTPVSASEIAWSFTIEAAVVSEGAEESLVPTPGPVLNVSVAVIESAWTLPGPTEVASVAVSESANVAPLPVAVTAESVAVSESAAVAVAPLEASTRSEAVSLSAGVWPTPAEGVTASDPVSESATAVETPDAVAMESVKVVAVSVRSLAKSKLRASAAVSESATVWADPD